LDDVALREKIGAQSFAFRGRAAVRLARAVAIARDLNERARGPSPARFETGAA